MARIKGPLMSLSASGALGRHLLFRSGKKAGHVYRPADPRKVNQAQASARQGEIRATYASARANWQVLSPAQRAVWDAKAAASPTGVTGWNLYLQAAMRETAEPASTEARLFGGSPLIIDCTGAARATGSATLTLDLRAALRT